MIYRLLPRNLSACHAGPVAAAGANEFPHGMSCVNLTCPQLDSSWRPE
jgi:hypothetical protein